MLTFGIFILAMLTFIKKR
ncbi:hypothetical protein BS614_28380 [Paenibacillus xylanexedens]|nr:hypothetical protein BS614_28380 [Paenibacillus xylanexedens]